MINQGSAYPKEFYTKKRCERRILPQQKNLPVLKSIKLTIESLRDQTLSLVRLDTPLKIY